MVDLEKKEDAKKKGSFNILFEDSRTPEQKKKDAFTAYQKIVYKEKKGRIDDRILSIMDQDLLKQF